MLDKLRYSALMVSAQAKENSKSPAPEEPKEEEPRVFELKRWVVVSFPACFAY
jgi:hypothetical protein